MATPHILALLKLQFFFMNPTIKAFISHYFVTIQQKQLNNAAELLIKLFMNSYRGKFADCHYF